MGKGNKKGQERKGKERKVKERKEKAEERREIVSKRSAAHTPGWSREQRKKC